MFRIGFNIKRFTRSLVTKPRYKRRTGKIKNLKTDLIRLGIKTDIWETSEEGTMESPEDLEIIGINLYTMVYNEKDPDDCYIKFTCDPDNFPGKNI